ncbi:MAG TPA: ATP-binding protein, partial [Nautiliaceae bacterium]|nr:ATP-binding protein [Nautiliaceae bacterium]
MFDENFVIEYFEKLFERLKKEEIKQRELKISLIKNKATAIIGPRRAGKTYFILKFLKENKNSIYFDLEHTVFKDLTHKEFFEIISVFEERFKIKVENILIDEIQRIDKWEILVRSLLDSGYKVIITGSSSKLLSKEISTQLRGRSLSYLLLPLSFREYLNFRNFNLRKPFSLSEKVKVINFLKDYLEWGSYPEILFEWDKKEKILKEYFDTVLQKDFIERFKVVNVEIAKLIFEFAFQNFSKELSINKIANFVSSKLSKNVKNIVYEYVEKLSESFAVFFVERFEESIYKRKSFMKKVYVCDVGLTNIIR